MRLRHVQADVAVRQERETHGAGFGRYGDADRSVLAAVMWGGRANGSPATLTSPVGNRSQGGVMLLNFAHGKPHST